jgi:G3E family GTPase
MLFNGEVCDDWEVDEDQRRSKLVFIGVDLPHQRIKDDFEQCVFVEENLSQSQPQSQKKKEN